MVMNPLDLTGKVAVVTGAGQGIGLSIARVLSDNGAEIVVAEMNPETGKQAVAGLEASGRKALFIQTDVRSVESVNAMTRTAVDAFGKIDILVNNAGIVHNTPAEDTPDDEWRSIIDVNINGVFWCCRAVGRQMLEQGSGAIVNIASMSGMIVNKPQPQAAYNVSKAAVIMMTKSLAAEWARRGVRVNSVSPGYIGTELTRFGLSKKEWSEMWFEMTPMQRIGEPDDIAHAVLYLASPAAKFATGTNLVVDGGYTAW
jgi:NAD(P)-dependent dehydrogenase (short-subunit alcohol dehydrogenase family)